MYRINIFDEVEFTESFRLLDRLIIEYRFANSHVRFCFELWFQHDRESMLVECEPEEEKKVRDIVQPRHEYTSHETENQHYGEFRPTVSCGCIDDRGNREVEESEYHHALEEPNTDRKYHAINLSIETERLG